MNKKIYFYPQVLTFYTDPTLMNQEERLQERLRADDSAALEEVYLHNRDYFIQYFQQRQQAIPELEDIYQDSVIALYQNFVTRQLQLSQSTVRTYLMAIGKNKVARFVKKKVTDKQNDICPPETQIAVIPEIPLFDSGLSHEQQLLATHFQRLGKKCQSLLKLYYYRGLTIKEILEQTDYKDLNTIKSSKSRCLKKLKELIHTDKSGAR